MIMPILSDLKVRGMIFLIRIFKNALNGDTKSYNIINCKGRGKGNGR